MLSAIRSRWTELFACDLRALAAMRIALAAIYVVDMLGRLEDLGAFYTDAGLLPRDALLAAKFINTWHVSLLFMNGQNTFALMCVALGVLSGLLLLLGVYTRLVSVLCWVILISFHSRNPMILHGGDTLLRLLLFWAMFLPWQQRWSFDRLRAESQMALAADGASLAKSTRFASAATLATMVQVALIYPFTVLQKSGKEWWPDGTAVYYALHLDSFAKPLAIWFRQFPELMRWSTFATLAAEAVLPLLLFAPFATRWCRLVGACCLMAMHITFGLFLELGSFPWVDVASFLIFVPSFVWDELELKTHRALQCVRSWQRPWQLFKAGVLARMPWQPSMALAPGRLTQLLVLALLVYTLAWNATTIAPWKLRLDRSVSWIGHLLRLDQSWGMFAPFPMKDDGWYVVEGKLRDGTPVDVRQQKEGLPSDAKPDDVRSSYIDSRWRKYLLNLWMQANKDHRLYYGRYLCRSWNLSAEHQRALETFTIFYMREDTLADYQPSVVKKVAIWRHNCFT